MNEWYSKQTALIVHGALYAALAGLLIYGIVAAASFAGLAGRFKAVDSKIDALARTEPGLVDYRLYGPLLAAKKYYAATTDALLAEIKKRTPVFNYPIPLEFRDQLLKTQRDLLNKAQASGIEVPAAIGFDDYAGGKVPKETDIPALVRQLHVLRRMTELILGCGVKKITMVKRETAADYRQDMDALYCELNFTITFNARFDTLVRIMNEMLNERLFLIVKQVNITKTANDLADIELHFSYIELVS